MTKLTINTPEIKMVEEAQRKWEQGREMRNLREEIANYGEGEEYAHFLNPSETTDEEVVSMGIELFSGWDERI